MIQFAQRRFFAASREIIINAVRHSGAQNLWIESVKTEGGVEVRARDDGRGVKQLRAGNGCGDIGNVRHLKEHTGRIRTMTTIGKAGNGTKDTGIARTTTMTIGGTMIEGGGITPTMTRGMSTKRQHQRNGTVAGYNFLNIVRVFLPIQFRWWPGAAVECISSGAERGALVQ